MALPQDGQNANGLTKVTEVPTGKELIFVDPTTNEGGIITLEDLTTQILNKLTSKIFTLDQGNITLIEALNKLNSKSKRTVVDGNSVQIDLEKYKTAIVFGTVNTTSQSLILVTRNYTDKITAKSIYGASETSITGKVDLETENVTLNFSGNNSAIIIW